MNFTLRPMEEKDLDLTFTWRNDSGVLKNATTSNPISKEEHDAMFLYNNAIKLIFEVDAVSVGFVSFSRDPDAPVGEWAFHLGEEFRGHGLSEMMLKMALYYIKMEEGYTEITSTVLTHNDISIYLHQKLGFEYTGTKNNMNEYWISL